MHVKIKSPQQNINRKEDSYVQRLYHETVGFAYGLEIKLQENDEAFHIHHFVERIPEKALEGFYKTRGYTPSYHTINRFRIHPAMKELLRQCFVQFRSCLVEEKMIDIVNYI